jgi:hypothetical protein
MPSGMDRNSANCICPILLTYLCVDFKELPDDPALKVINPVRTFTSENGIQMEKSCRPSNLFAQIGGRDWI